MNEEPRFAGDYSARQTEAARRALVDVGQVLASFRDSIVVVGGWVPDLLLPVSDEPHVKSIDVDLALDAAKLTDGRYADDPIAFIVGALERTDLGRFHPPFFDEEPT
jgi:hypothetical protein